MEGELKEEKLEKRISKRRVH